ncbi:hypothetical protein APY04_2809 [Hyphomicrobium sulfonivorans]|uniref:Uncharacterized protein n=1 Tax=Hyphomicrobium sulfonivorans TaxID=121290 RepID=A0A120CU02_HYPSL|nr:hypothetical protein APY04_2809 [Hyphomicrobium sulfonivorans]
MECHCIDWGSASLPDPSGHLLSSVAGERKQEDLIGRSNAALD